MNAIGWFSAQSFNGRTGEPVTACIHVHKCRDGQGNICQNDATVFYVAPDGEQVPGAGACDMHARRTVLEYRDKMGEVWTLRPVCEHVQPVTNPLTDDEFRAFNRR